jgi:hypothetical protein
MEYVILMQPRHVPRKVASEWQEPMCKTRYLVITNKWDKGQLGSVVRKAQTQQTFLNRRRGLEQTLVMQNYKPLDNSPDEMLEVRDSALDGHGFHLGADLIALQVHSAPHLFKEEEQLKPCSSWLRHDRRPDPYEWKESPNLPISKGVPIDEIFGPGIELMKLDSPALRQAGVWGTTGDVHQPLLTGEFLNFG